MSAKIVSAESSKEGYWFTADIIGLEKGHQCSIMLMRRLDYSLPIVRTKCCFKLEGRLLKTELKLEGRRHKQS